MSEPDLFGGLPGGGGTNPTGSAPRSGSDADATDRIDLDTPLAARMRPRTLDEFRGQRQLLERGKALQSMIEKGVVTSMILWGPPGSGKTTLARILAAHTDAAFVSLSAVSDGVARVREVTREARVRLEATSRRTILFCDEIHRFNKGQQDAFLPHVEEGTVILIGATTENPSFEVVRPLLSRAPVYVLEPLTAEDLEAILRRALTAEHGLGPRRVEAEPEALTFLAEASDGDARRALGSLETAADLVGEGGTITRERAAEALQHRFALYDKAGEEHFNLISALHKSIRGSDPDGALYWLARMLRGGEDPLYVARRLVRMASEDIGLADPRALEVTVAARDAYHFLGSPEGELALAEAAVYLAVAPKSNKAYEAWKAAMDAAGRHPSEPVPLHLRNAPTGLMKELGYGDGYRYDPDEEGGVADQSYLPPVLAGSRFYRPGTHGWEERIRERLRWIAEQRASRGVEEV